MLRIPLAVGVAQREDPLLRARSLLVAPRAAEGGIEVTRLERIEQRLRLERAAAGLGAHQKGLRAGGNPLLRYCVFDRGNDQTRADFSGVPVAELDNLAELVRRVDVQQRKRDRAGVKRLLGEPQQDRSSPSRSN